jgi:hypothetical protein
MSYISGFTFHTFFNTNFDFATIDDVLYEQLMVKVYF